MLDQLAFVMVGGDFISPSCPWDLALKYSDLGSLPPGQECMNNEIFLQERGLCFSPSLKTLSKYLLELVSWALLGQKCLIPDHGSPVKSYPPSDVHALCENLV